ncbi:MAG: hypothetical protein GXP29_13600 [Planctomycetes bacterium]|nr:hypothetical protein [Planctomycetota bacterium]
MTTETLQNRSSLTPLILRVAVAGALAFSGFAQLQRGPDELVVDAPVELQSDANSAGVVTPAIDPLAVGDDSQAASSLGATLADRAKTVLSTTHADASGVEVKMGWQQFTGLAEMSFAAVLLLGIFVRMTSLLGVSAASLGTLAGTGVIDGSGMFAPLASVFEANPLAMMLLGAICLTLLFSGSGPLALDRIMFGRRKVAEPLA